MVHNTRRTSDIQKQWTFRELSVNGTVDGNGYDFAFGWCEKISFARLSGHQ
jgi:hypothetical protein